MPARLLILVLAACLASGCGDGGSDEGGQALLDRLPPDSTMVAAADVAAAREALGLAENADLAVGGSGDERRLALAAAYALPHLQEPVRPPILEALDHKRIVAAASGGPQFNEQLTVVRTTQPPGDVLEGLEDEGYERDGDLVVTDMPPSAVVYGAAAESEGLVYLASDDDLLRETLAEEEEGQETSDAARLVRDELEGPVRFAIANPDADCLKALGAQDSLDPATGEFVLDVAGETDPDRVGLGDDSFTERFLRGTRFEDARADGELLRVPFSYDADDALPSPVGLLTADVPTITFYDCG